MGGRNRLGAGGHGSGDQHQFVARLAIYAAVACAVLPLVLWTRMSLDRVVYPYQLDYGEGALLDNVRQYVHGYPLYSEPDQLPCNPLVYGPAYPMLWGALYPLAPSSFWPGRLLAFLAMAGVALGVFVFVRAQTGWWAPAIVAAGFFLSLDPVRAWSGMAKPGSLALVLSLVGWAVFVYLRRLRWLGAVLMVAAALTRQSMLAAPAAAVLAVARAGERRSALGYLGLMVGLGAAALAGLQAWTGGAFWRDAVTALGHQAWLPALFLQLLLRYVLLAPTACLAAVLIIYVGCRDERLRPVALYAVAATAMLLLSGKIGASVNYYLEFSAVASLGLGLLLARWSNVSGRWLAVVCLSALAIVQMMRAPQVGLWVEVPMRDGKALASAVASERGEVLSEWMGPVVQAGKTLWVEPFVTSQMARAGRWDQGPLLAMIRGHRFGLVVMSDAELRGVPINGIYGRWTDAERTAVIRNYAPVRSIGGYWLLRPRARASDVGVPRSVHHRPSPSPRFR